MRLIPNLGQFCYFGRWKEPQSCEWWWCWENNWNNISIVASYHPSNIRYASEWDVDKFQHSWITKFWGLLCGSVKASTWNPQKDHPYQQFVETTKCIAIALKVNTVGYELNDLFPEPVSHICVLNNNVSWFPNFIYAWTGSIKFPGWSCFGAHKLSSCCHAVTTRGCYAE